MSGDGRVKCPECGRPIKALASKRSQAMGVAGRVAAHSDYREVWAKGGYLRKAPKCAGSGKVVEAVAEGSA